MKIDVLYEVVYGGQSLHMTKTRLEDLTLGDWWKPTLLSERQSEEVKKVIDAIDEWFLWLHQAR